MLLSRYYHIAMGDCNILNGMKMAAFPFVHVADEEILKMKENTVPRRWTHGTDFRLKFFQGS